jgi:hypothetical protein
VACFGKLPPSARAAWEGAVSYYAEIISPAPPGSGFAQSCLRAPNKTDGRPAQRAGRVQPRDEAEGRFPG